MAHQVNTCVHCGFCLPVCPTYKELGQEMDSPRGRILLMKEMLEGSLEIEEGTPYSTLSNVSSVIPRVLAALEIRSQKRWNSSTLLRVNR